MELAGGVLGKDFGALEIPLTAIALLATPIAVTISLAWPSKP